MWSWNLAAFLVVGVGRRLRVPQPPHTDNIGLNEYLRRIADALNEFPNFIQDSTTDGPEGVIDGQLCDVFFDTSSSATTCSWLKTSDNTSVGWRAYDLI